MNQMIFGIGILVLTGFMLQFIALIALSKVMATLAGIRTDTRNQIEVLIMNQNELAAELRAVKAQVAKIGTETSATLQKVLDLEAVIAAGSPVSEDVLTALAELKTQAQATDDLTPDAAPPTP